MIRRALVLVCAGALAVFACEGHGLSARAASAAGDGQAGIAQDQDQPESLAGLVAGDTPLILHLWATWCPPCRTELPDLADFRAALPESLGDRLVIASVDTRPLSEIRQILDEEMDLPDFETHLVDPAEAGRLFRILGYPVTLFIASDGRILRRIEGAAPWSDSRFRRAAIGHIDGGS